MAIIFRRAEKLIRPAFQGFQANITAYTVAMVSRLFGDRFSLDSIWQQQGLSDLLSRQLVAWAGEVNEVLRRTAGERIVSEWAKKEECWEGVASNGLSPPNALLPEISS